MKDVTDDEEIPTAAMVDLTDGKKLFLLKEEGGRVVVISIANN